jgi:hypothetical protein
MKVMQIFEPAMCCSTGLCGVSVDPELLRISAVLNTLENNGITVQRYNLSSAPQEFINNQGVSALLNKNGVDALPATVVDGEIVLTGRYPTNEEIAKFLDIQTSMFDEKPKVATFKIKKTGGCGCSGGDCCR